MWCGFNSVVIVCLLIMIICLLFDVGFYCTLLVLRGFGFVYLCWFTDFCFGLFGIAVWWLGVWFLCCLVVS